MPSMAAQAFIGLNIPCFSSGRLNHSHEWENLLTYFSSASQSCLNASSFFQESNSFISRLQVGFRPGQCALNQILYFSHSISDGFTYLNQGLRQFLPLLIFLRHLTWFGTPFFFHKLIFVGLC